jgi:hypothetical protein
VQIPRLAPLAPTRDDAVSRFAFLVSRFWWDVQIPRLAPLALTRDDVVSRFSFLVSRLSFQELFMSRLMPAVIALTVLAACGDDPSGTIPGGGDPENISRVSVVLTPTAGGSEVRSTRVDPDGTQLPAPPGEASAVLTLVPGASYDGHIEILNDLDPANVVDVVAEVEEEANFHRFFYSASCAGVTVPVSSLNQDNQTPPAPLGTHFRLTVAADAPPTADCVLTVSLHHFETDKGDGAGANFETDLELGFPVAVGPQ